MPESKSFQIQLHLFFSSMSFIRTCSHYNYTFLFGLINSFLLHRWTAGLLNLLQIAVTTCWQTLNVSKSNAFTLLALFVWVCVAGSSYTSCQSHSSQSKTWLCYISPVILSNNDIHPNCSACPVLLFSHDTPSALLLYLSNLDILTLVSSFFLISFIICLSSETSRGYWAYREDYYWPREGAAELPWQQQHSGCIQGCSSPGCSQGFVGQHQGCAPSWRRVRLRFCSLSLFICSLYAYQSVCF